MPELHFTDQDRKSIIDAIETAEKQSSGEIQVHIENRCAEDVLDRAAEVFALLKMHKTELRNGVLFYLAVKDHKFALLGDKGINAVVPDHFWDDVKELMQNRFRKGEFTEGLREGILLAGNQLKSHFPDKGDGKNELPNTISFGK